MSPTPNALSGVHHVSTVSANIKRTRDFYMRVLGMKPVITTVNQDEPTMYHLFFGDGAGSPGSDITIFDIPHAAPEVRGNNALSLTTLRVDAENAMEFWEARFNSLGVTHRGIGTRDDRVVLDFEDFEGTQLSLVDDYGIGDAHPWTDSPVPAEYQIRGLGYVVMTVPDSTPTHRFLTEALGLRFDHTYPLAEAPQFNVLVYEIGGGGAHAEVHVIVRDDLPKTRYGAGGVHHAALRVPKGQRLESWMERLNSLSYRNSGLVDRHYFMSLYVREPNHVLFELATDGPGFDVDGPPVDGHLSLPPFLEGRRTEIERGLEPLFQSRT